MWSAAMPPTSDPAPSALMIVAHAVGPPAECSLIAGPRTRKTEKSILVSEATVTIVRTQHLGAVFLQEPGPGIVRPYEQRGRLSSAGTVRSPCPRRQAAMTVAPACVAAS